jgi:hypothetical protein
VVAEIDNDDDMINEIINISNDMKSIKILSTFIMELQPQIHHFPNQMNKDTSEDNSSFTFPIFSIDRSSNSITSKVEEELKTNELFFKLASKIYLLWPKLADDFLYIHLERNCYFYLYWEKLRLFIRFCSYLENDIPLEIRNLIITFHLNEFFAHNLDN